MLALRLLPVVLALLVLGAHFYRAGESIPVVVVVALLVLLPLRRRWVPRVIQAALALGAVEWIRTLLDLVAVRQAMGAPSTRLALILGGVALATLACALVFRARRVRAYYERGAPTRDETRSAHPQ